MKVQIIQPPYPFLSKEKSDTFQYILNSLALCKDDIELILLPEYSNVPGVSSKSELEESFIKNTDILLKEAEKTAKRCRTFVAVNLVSKNKDKFCNTTCLFDKNGKILAKYYKQHLTQGEIAMGLDNSYIYNNPAPLSISCGGIKFGFLICYDIYFDEYIERLASMDVDVILLSSYQRGEDKDILEMQAKTCALRCNSYVLRSSYSMGSDSKTGGCSMLVSPDGKIVSSMGQNMGSLVEEIDPTKKHTRSNGYGQPEIKSNMFIEKSRTPWVYRPSGSMVCPVEKQISYPRICAHRGFSVAIPENTMPSFAAAIALGAEEIELDLWESADGELIVIHDDSVDRITDGHGKVSELTYSEISQLDAGSKFSPHYSGLRLCRFDDVLRQFARQVIVNIHIKSPTQQEEYDHGVFKKILGTIDKYDCREHVYIAGWRDVLTTALKLAPDIPRCCLEGQSDYTLVENAIKYKCEKLQFFKPYFTQSMIDKAHQHNIRCNIFWSDDPDEAKRFLDMGIDTILTNDYLAIKGKGDGSFCLP